MIKDAKTPSNILLHQQTDHQGAASGGPEATPTAGPSRWFPSV